MAEQQGTAAALIAVARGEIGTMEGRDPDGSWNNRIKYNDWYVKALNAGSGFLTASWCAIFVSWCAMKAGISRTIIPWHAWTPSGWQWFVDRGRAVNVPESGDIMYVYYDSIGMIGHVGMVERREGNYIYTIEGNTNTDGSSQGKGVYRLKRLITGNLHFARPAYNSVDTGSLPVSPSSGSSNPAPAKSSSTSSVKLVKKVYVSHLKAARYADPPKNGRPVGVYGNEVFTLERALVILKWLRPGMDDGHYGSDTVGNGADMNFGGAKGFQVKHSPTIYGRQIKPTDADGWLGPKELRLAFDMAGMRDVQVFN